MINRETPTFKASMYAPNPQEVTYWIDLNEESDGQVIKTFNGKEWVRLNDKLNDQQTAEIEVLKDRCTNLEQTKLDKTEFNLFVQEVNQVHNELEQNKADKATTLAGYGITDAYTKNETDTRINTAVADLVNQAPETLDTLDELAAALGDDPNFATTIANQIGTKANSADVYTKTQCDAKIDEKIAAADIVSSTDISSIQVVSELPAIQTNGVLYIKVS